MRFSMIMEERELRERYEGKGKVDKRKRNEKYMVGAWPSHPARRIHFCSLLMSTLVDIRFLLLFLFLFF